jgi:hypothetical protein
LPRNAPVSALPSIPGYLKNFSMCIRFATFFALACLVSGAACAAPSTQPDYSATISARVLYDDNVFIQDAAPLAIGQTIPALPARAGAFVGSLGVNLGVTWKHSPALQLDLGYAPEVFRYSRYQSENHADHRFTANVLGSSGAWRYEAKTGWLSTFGSTDSPVFNRLGGSPPIGSEPVRARRAQDILKSSGRVTRTLSRGFVRGVFALSDQDFHTRQSPTAGYANYVDRGEWSAGGELGWAVRPDFFLVAAARTGRQHQADLLGSPVDYTNTLTRWLFGAEGKISANWKFSLLAGPDVRRFGSDVRAGFDRHQSTTYWEAAASWTPTKADLITLGSRHYLWVSSGGRSIYLDTVYDLAWKHQLGPAWSLNSGYNQHRGYTGRFNPLAPRDDVIHALTLGCSHALDAKTKIDLGVARDWSVSGLPATPGREYHRWIYTAGYSRRW